MWGAMTSFDDIMRCVEKWGVHIDNKKVLFKEE